MNFFKRIKMNVFSFLSWLWYSLKNDLLDFSKLADLLKKKQEIKITGDFLITTLKEENKMGKDYLALRVRPNITTSAKDIVKWELAVKVNDEAQETRFSVDEFEIEVLEGAKVDLAATAIDNAGNRSNTIEKSFVAVDTVAPILEGDLDVTVVGERFEEDASQPVEEPTPVVDEVPATEPVNEEPAPVVEETQPVEEPAAEPVTEDVPATEEASELSEESATEPEVVETTPVEDTTAPVVEEVQPEVTEGESSEATTEESTEATEETQPVDESVPTTEEASEETSFPVEGSNEAEKPAE